METIIKYGSSPDGESCTMLNKTPLLEPTTEIPTNTLLIHKIIWFGFIHTASDFMESVHAEPETQCLCFSQVCGHFYFIFYTLFLNQPPKNGAL